MWTVNRPTQRTHKWKEKNFHSCVCLMKIYNHGYLKIGRCDAFMILDKYKVSEKRIQCLLFSHLPWAYDWPNTTISFDSVQQDAVDYSSRVIRMHFKSKREHDLWFKTLQASARFDSTGQYVVSNLNFKDWPFSDTLFTQGVRKNWCLSYAKLPHSGCNSTEVTRSKSCPLWELKRLLIIREMTNWSQLRLKDSTQQMNEASKRYYSLITHRYFS